MLIRDHENLNRNLSERYSNLQDRNEELKKELNQLEKKNNGLVGFKGTDQFDVGYIYCPYVPGT